jgi:hypothetical protein
MDRVSKEFIQHGTGKRNKKPEGFLPELAGNALSGLNHVATAAARAWQRLPCLLRRHRGTPAPPPPLLLSERKKEKKNNLAGQTRRKKAATVAAAVAGQTKERERLRDIFGDERKPSEGSGGAGNRHSCRIWVEKTLDLETLHAVLTHLESKAVSGEEGKVVPLVDSFKEVPTTHITAVGHRRTTAAPPGGWWPEIGWHYSLSLVSLSVGRK